MAIVKTYNSEFGVDFPEAYWMISRIETDRLSQKINVWVAVFSSAESRVSLNREVASFTFIVPEIDYDNCITNGLSALYESLKKDDRFSGGVDV